MLYALAVAAAGHRAGDVAQSTWRYTHRQTVCHCARAWRRRLVCAVHVRHQQSKVKVKIRIAVCKQASSAYWGLTVCRRQLCSRCSVRSSSLSSLTPLRRDGALRPTSTDSVSMLFCVELFGLTCGHCLGSLTRIRSRTSATQLMMNCSSKSEPPTTFYIHSCQHNPPHHKITISDSVYTHFSYLNAQHISLTVTSWCACCIQELLLGPAIVHILLYVRHSHCF